MLTNLQFPIAASCPFSLHPDFTLLPLEDPPEVGKVGQVQFGPYKGAPQFEIVFFCFFSLDFLGKPLSTFLPVEWGGQVFAYCAEKGFPLTFLSYILDVMFFEVTFCYLTQVNKILKFSLQISFSPT